MSVFKRIEPNDITVTPFDANKQYIITSSIASASYGIYMIRAKNDTHVHCVSDGNYSTNAHLKLAPDGRYEYVYHDSINNLFYKDYDLVPLDLFSKPNKFQKRELHEICHFLSIPQAYFGQKVRPGYVTLTLHSGSSEVILTDDGYGNLLDTRFTSSYNAIYDYSNYLVGDWNFRQGYRAKDWIVSASNIIDWSTYENNGYFENLKFTDGLYGTQCTFVNSGSYIRIPHNDNYNFKHNKDFALSFVLTVPLSQSDVGSTENVILAKNERYSRYNYVNNRTVFEEVYTPVQGKHPYSINLYNQSSADSGKLSFNRRDGNNLSQVKTKDPINDGNFHYIVCQKTGSAIEIYVDGFLSATAADYSVGDTHNLCDVFVGLSGRMSGSFSGSIDEIKIYNRALDSQDIFDTSQYFLSQSLNPYVGNVFYEFGFVTITSPYDYYKNLDTGSWQLNYMSTRTIYEWEVDCTVEGGEYNQTLNPTCREYNDPNSEVPRMFVTHSEFSPYVTTVGLYSDNGELVALGKPSQPIKKLKNVDMTFIVRFDV